MIRKLLQSKNNHIQQSRLTSDGCNHIFQKDQDQTDEELKQSPARATDCNGEEIQVSSTTAAATVFVGWILKEQNH